LNTELRSSGYGLSYGDNAFLVTKNARLSFGFRPASITVHNDGNMLRKGIREGLRILHRELIEFHQLDRITQKNAEL
jgi:hypothetical protein